MKTCIIIFLYLIVGAGWAQVIVTSGSVVTIPTNVVFYSTGDFTNNGTVVNNGSLVLSGAWTNTGTYQAGSGQVTFNGSGSQIINHDAQSFAKLLIDGGGQKIFRADIVVTSELSLQDGILSSDNSSKIILAQPAVVTGGSDNSFVQAAVYNTGTGMKLFPVGFNAQYLPLTFTNVTGNSPVVGIEVIEPNPNSNVEIALKSVSSLRYWKVDSLSGVFGGSPVTLPLTGEDASAPVVVAQAAGSTAPFISVGGTVQSSSVSSTDNVLGPWIAVAYEKSRDLLVYNAVTPGNNDGKHDFLKIVNIDLYPNNEVTIINRWGDKIFQMSGYNNRDRVFNGEGNVGGTKAISDGTYYYVIDKKNGDEKISGFFILRR
jgi:gliding motility-associated-like protein